MKLCELIKDIDIKKLSGNGGVEITGLCADSHSVKEGDLFFCYVGTSCDSHGYVQEALKNGAAAVVCERELNISVPQVVVSSGRAVIAPFARRFYGFPDKKLKLIAVTGTNGKTTTTYMLKSIFEAAGKSVGVIGTLGISYADIFIAPELTTPDPIYLQSVLADMVDKGVEYVFMETSAHALYFGKTDGITFDVGIFTNCTQDHLDFFGNMRDYFSSKKLLFKKGKCKYAIINSDDEYGRELLEEVETPISFGLKNPADVFAIDIVEKINGNSFVINLFDELYDFSVGLPALHNVYNALGAAAAAKVLGINTEYIANGLKELKNVSGRLERVASYNGADIFVDFAHTPDGLEKSLQALKKLCKGRLFCLFGCGGNRDKTKRPIMGGIAAKYSDFCIVTSDNPRFEDPYDIISQIEEGIKSLEKSYVTITDRETATGYAISLLNSGDILLVAGKGGEYYQEIMGIKHSYNDNDVIKKLIS